VNTVIYLYQHSSIFTCIYFEGTLSTFVSQLILLGMFYVDDIFVFCEAKRKSSCVRREIQDLIPARSGKIFLPGQNKTSHRMEHNTIGHISSRWYSAFTSGLLAIHACIRARNPGFL